MDEKNMRNCRDRANKNDCRVVHIQVILLWGTGQTSYPLQGPSSLISCHCCSCLLQESTSSCRKAPRCAGRPGISLLSHLCRTPSSTGAAAAVPGAAAGCGCHGVGLIPHPRRGAQPHPPGHRSGDGSSGQQRAQCRMRPAATLSPS